MEGKVLLRKYLILVILLLLGQLQGYKSCVEKERKALLELKQYLISISIEEDSDSFLPTWTYDTKSDCCLWEGIKCNSTSKRVAEMAFGTLKLKELSLLNLSLLHPFENVRYLNISGNYFKGMFDDVEGYKSLGRLRNLETLDLSSNSFDNSIFPFVNAATSLTTLSLRSNDYLIGPFPGKELEDLTNLELLDLSNSGFNGSLEVQDLSTLKMLKSLNLSYNGFTSPMAIQGNKSLCILRNLEILDLYQNSFSNSIFPFVNAITSLKTLFLGSNSMYGSFPAEEIKDLANLELLDLSENYFDGSIPIRVSPSLRKLKALDLSGNAFSASMGWQGICEMKNLQELDLSRNKFVGPFPLCLTGLTGLRVLDLSSNQLNGKLPSTLGNLGSLRYLSLLDNNFEGSFSVGSLANLSELKVFKLNSKSKSLQVESEGSWKPKFQLSVIELPSCNLVKIPYFILSQKDLSRIDLSDNKISGAFPQWLFVNNTKLEVLFLQNNLFTSFQLQESAHNLRFLDVSANAFNHHLPEDIGWLLPHLTYMKLAGNGFQGDLPSSLGNMERLKYLDISNNNFHGKLPRSLLMGCYSMRILTLSHNKLCGEVFLEPFNLTLMEELSMDNNLFTGKIGGGLRNIEELYVLDISYNRLTGEIPSWVGEIRFLNALLLSNNLLEGPIPISLFNRSDLGLLDLSANTLSGNIPSSEGPGALLLQDNNLSGVIPNTLIRDVFVLDLRNNRLSGNIPEFNNSPYIHSLLLRGNNLTGNIPRQLCDLRNIQLLDLSNNRLNGSIPSCFSNTSFVFGIEDSVFDQGYGNITKSVSIRFLVDEDDKYFKSRIMIDKVKIGDIPSILIKMQFATKHRYDAYMGGNLELLYGMDLSNNELSGEIPAELGGLLELQVLNLSHNCLSGVIPQSFSGLKNVESLDLSFNRLQGRIPSQLTELNSLAVFNVSFNNLSGVIPQGKQFNTFDAKSYLANPLLCGQSVDTSCNSSHFKELEDDESAVDMVSFYWSLVAAYVTILIGISSSLSFDSPWSRYWFYLVDAFIHKAKSLLW